MLCGLTSRWTMPAAWAASSALGDLGEQLDRFLRRQRPVRGDPSLQVAALDQAHRDDQLAVLLAGVEDWDHVGVVEPGGEPRLAQEAIAEAAGRRRTGGRSPSAPPAGRAPGASPGRRRPSRPARSARRAGSPPGSSRSPVPPTWRLYRRPRRPEAPEAIGRSARSTAEAYGAYRRRPTGPAAMRSPDRWRCRLFRSARSLPRARSGGGWRRRSATSDCCSSTATKAATLRSVRGEDAVGLRAVGQLGELAGRRRRRSASTQRPWSRRKSSVRPFGATSST